MSKTTKIITYEGNAVRHTFKLKQFGRNAPVDVSLASPIEFEWELPDGANQTPITVNIGEAGADWANGIVVVFIQSPITDAIGDYPFSLTVTLNGETISYATGEVNVLDRRGFTV